MMSQSGEANSTNDICDTVAHSASVLPAAQDARQIRTARALSNALLRLLDNKPLEQVTIREIAAEAGIHYATFFRHYPTKEALLDHVAADQIAQLVAHSLPIFDDADGTAAFAALCDYVDSNRSLWTVLLTGGARSTMREEFLAVSRAVAENHVRANLDMPVDLSVIASVTIIVESLSWWLSPAGTGVANTTMAKYMQQLINF